MALSHTPRYTDHPLSWERTDLGRPLMKLAVTLVALIALGVALAYLFSVIASVGDQSHTFGGDERGGLPLAFFSLLFVLLFVFPTNVMFMIGLAAVVMIPVLAYRRWRVHVEDDDAERIRLERRASNSSDMTVGGFLGK